MASGGAWAEDAPPATDMPSATDTPSATDAKPTADEPDAAETDDAAGAQPEVIEVWEERKEKPFNRDTQLRLTGEDLKKRGATNLADSLALLPDVVVREAGRGGQQIDIRGARKGSVKILIDGIAVTDPYFGTFDLTTVPVTDIVQIRVTSSPASPIDGPGGPGALIEVHTRDAVGGRLVTARLQAKSVPGFDGSVTGRLKLAKHLALRLSASGELGSRDIPLPMPYTGEVDEDRNGVNGAMRLEYRKGSRRAVVDVFAYSRRYVVPPGRGDNIALLNPDSGGRIGVSVDDKLGKLRVRSNAYFHAQQLTRLRYRDEALTDLNRTISSDIDATRAGVFALVNRPIGKHLQVIASASVDTNAATETTKEGDVVDGRASTVSAASGVQYEKGALKIDVAAGGAVPFGVNADPWPEAKLVVHYRLSKPLTVRATGARKGRVPTLRERYEPLGDPDLEPEQATFGELALIMRPKDGMRIEATSYIRDTDGLIRFDFDQGRLINLGSLIIRGFDIRGRFTVADGVRIGGSYLFQDAFSKQSGTDPLDFLPRHRGDAWIKARVGEALGGWVRLRYIGDQIDRGETLGAQVALDASAYYRVSKNLFASLRVDNSLDDDFDVRADVPNQGRTFTLSLQGTFE